MLGYDVVEIFEMPRFLVIHVLHKRPQVRMILDNNRSLSGVNKDGSEFASLIDTNLSRGQVRGTKAALSRHTALSRNCSCSSVKARRRFPLVPCSMVLGLGSVLGDAENVVMVAICCRVLVCNGGDLKFRVHRMQRREVMENIMKLLDRYLGAAFLNGPAKVPQEEGCAGRVQDSVQSEKK